MFRGLLIILISFVALNHIHGQSEIYISNAARDINIVTIASGNCSQVNVVNTDRTLSDITLHPSGRMFGCNFSTRRVYEVDLQTGVTSEILEIAEANRLVGMTADANGLLYVTEGEVIPSDLYVVDPIAGTYVNKGALADGSAGDLTWSFGKLYNASDNNKLVEVNVEDPPNSDVIGDFVGLAQNGDRIFALVSVFTSCTETATFGLSEFGDYYTLDLQTATVNLLCVGSINIYGATSADEFLASECFVGLDLDADNSSGAMGNDFETDFDCPSTSAAIADDDDLVLVASQVDSVVVSISSAIPDGASEFLEVGSSPNLTVNNSGFFLSAVSTGASTADIEIFLRTLRYRNTAIPATPGLREITVIGHSEGETDTAYAEILLSGLDAGLDNSLIVCANDAPVDLFSILGGIPDPGGSWLPLTMAGNGIFDPSVDPGGTYTYTVTDGCFEDESEVVVTLLNEANPLDLGNDTIICSGGSLTLDAEVALPGVTYLWYTGATTPFIDVDSSGNYSVTASYLGCSFMDDIDVTFQDVQVDIGGDISLCAGDNVTISAVVGSPTATYEWSNGSTNPVLNITVGGEYWVIVTDGGCSDADTIMVTEVMGGEIVFSLGPDQTICLGESVTFQSGFSPLIYDHTWSTGSNNPSITTSSEGSYSLNLSNECQTGSDTVMLIVEDCDTIVDPPDTTVIDPPDTIDIPDVEICELKFPTAFSPNGDGFNDRFGLLNICPDLQEYEFRVYNRFGERVFSGNELSFWDGSFKGQVVDLDVFIWYLSAMGSSGDQRYWTGSVLVLR